MVFGKNTNPRATNTTKAFKLEKQRDINKDLMKVSNS